jgi:hypothetical protein
VNGRRIEPPSDATVRRMLAVSAEATKGPASYFPSIEKTYGRPIGEWLQHVRDKLPAKHMDLVTMLKTEHGMGHGHANAIVAAVLAAEKR